MLDKIGVKSIDDLLMKTVPESIRLTEDAEFSFHQVLGEPESELSVKYLLQNYANRNEIWRTFIGQGWSQCETPSVITSNVLRNPAWNTAYTPYQAEISQGRLESLFNYQTMITELTGLSLANASLLDEATACAEAMSLIFSASRNKKQTFYIDSKCHPQNIGVMKSRAALK